MKSPQPRLNADAELAVFPADACRAVGSSLARPCRNSRPALVKPAVETVESYKNEQYGNLPAQHKFSATEANEIDQDKSLLKKLAAISTKDKKCEITE